LFEWSDRSTSCRASGKFKRGFLIGLYDICILLNFVKPVKIYYKYGSSNNSIVTENSQKYC